ncbi:MAG TPA: hypothetical protein VLZ06_07580 [Solirubrobacteraceae bacterium]|nr:hypothetical protein [Solirubrobacteraceae bacterium]
MKRARTRGVLITMLVGLGALAPLGQARTLEARSTRTARPKVERIRPPHKTGSRPVVTGQLEEGQTAGVDTGSWTGEPTFTYQWEQCNSKKRECALVHEATSSTYPLSAADVGHALRVLVIASNSAGSRKVRSLTSAVVTAGESGGGAGLIGESTAYMANNVNQNRGAILAWPFTARTTGTITKLHLYILTITAPGVEGAELGVYENHRYSYAEPFEVYGKKSAYWKAHEAEVPPECPGRLLGVGSVSFSKPAHDEWVEVTGLNINVTAGTQYWLAVVVHSRQNGENVYYGKKNNYETELKPWGNYSNEWENDARDMEELPPPPAAQTIKAPTRGWLQEEPPGTEFELGREAQEEGGPPSLYGD